MDKLTATMGVLMINTICTLKCKKCITQTPYHKNEQNYPFENLSKEIKTFFDIYHFVDHFDFEGGETLLHPQLSNLIEEALKYKDSFKTLNILTNGTMLPNEKTIEICKNQPILFIIDDYGVLSHKKEALMALLKEHDISFRVDNYHGDAQYYGGWIDFGDFSNKNYTKEQLQVVFNKCRSGNCGAPYIKNGKMLLCPVQASLKEAIPLQKNEYVDLCNDKISIEEKIQIAEKFGEAPIYACNYCLGFDVNSERIPAAIQLTAEDLKNINKDVIN